MAGATGTSGSSGSSGTTPARALRIAMLGLRGVPAAYSGIERHVEEIGARLVDRGHDITVFCHAPRRGARPVEHRGMRLRYVPTISTKHLETITHTGLSTVMALGDGYDIVHFHAVGPGLLVPLPKYLSRAKVVQTIHGLDADRAKWGTVARSVLKTAEWMSARAPDATITVSRTLRDHYHSRYDKETACIPNGVDRPQGRGAQEITSRYGLEPQGYVLFVGRLVPEKCPDVLISAFKQLPLPARLVIVGGSSHTDAYVRQLERQASDDPRVLLTGPLYGAVLDELYANAAVFVSPSMLEAGPPITMLEAVSHGASVLGSDIPAQVEALGDGGPGHRVFSAGDPDSLASALGQALSDPAGEQAAAGAWREGVLREHSWDDAAEATALLYEALVNQ